MKLDLNLDDDGKLFAQVIDGVIEEMMTDVELFGDLSGSEEPESDAAIKAAMLRAIEALGFLRRGYYSTWSERVHEQGVT